MNKVYESIDRFGQEWEGDVCLALGMFDGVHRGHQSVLDLVVQNAGHCRGAAVALTFPKHPAAFLRPGKEPSLLMSPCRKAEQLINPVCLRSFYNLLIRSWQRWKQLIFVLFESSNS
jgi:FAD synthase